MTLQEAHITGRRYRRIGDSVWIRYTYEEPMFISDAISDDWEVEEESVFKEIHFKRKKGGKLSTDCPNGSMCKVGSIWCGGCFYFIDRDEKRQIVYCGYNDDKEPSCSNCRNYKPK